LIVREAIKLAYERLAEGYIPVIVAPTSYGKTIGSLYILERARRDLLAPKLIHVVPLRALVREIYREKFANAGKQGFSVGYQMLDKIYEKDKSPYYLRDLVVTTLDSYLWNILRIPVAEYTKVVEGVSRGHYHPVLASIYNSVNVFDEAHLYISDVGRVDVAEIVYAVLSTLVEHDVPCIVETATMHSEVIRGLWDLLEDKLVVIYETCSGNIQVEKLKEIGISVETTCDQDFHTNHSGITWRTHIVKESEAIAKACELCREGWKVLIVRNTITKAIETYEKLLNMNCGNLYLLHSLIGFKDREQSLTEFSNLLTSNTGAVMVTTQVAEHGVSIEADALITDIAPIENLAQRAGRLCRDIKLEQCRKRGVDIYVIEPDQNIIDIEYFDVYPANRVYNTLKWLKDIVKIKGIEAIEWRLLENAENWKSFVEGLEYTTPPRVDKSLFSFFKDFITKYLDRETPQSILFDIARVYNSNFMRNFMVKLALQTKEGFNWQNYVSIDIDRLIRYESKLEKLGSSIKCLSTMNDRVGLLIFYTIEGEKEVKTHVEYIDKSKWMNVAKSDLKRYLHFLDDIFSNVIDKLRRENMGRGITIIDHYYLLNEECYYKNGEVYGAYHVVKSKGGEE